MVRPPAEKKMDKTMIYMEKEMLDKLSEYANKQHMTRSALIRLILKEGLDALDKKGFQLKLF